MFIKTTMKSIVLITIVYPQNCRRDGRRGGSRRSSVRWDVWLLLALGGQTEGLTNRPLRNGARFVVTLVSCVIGDSTLPLDHPSVNRSVGWSIGHILLFLMIFVLWPRLWFHLRTLLNYKSILQSWLILCKINHAQSS